MNFDVLNPQTRRFYGKVKRVGQMWVTPDGSAFPKQHLAYRSVHENQQSMDSLPPIYYPKDMTLEQFLEIKLPKVIGKKYRAVVKNCEKKTASASSFKQLVERSRKDKPKNK